MRFSIMSESEILKHAEGQVHLGQYYDSNRVPIKAGLLDPALVKVSLFCILLGWYTFWNWFADVLLAFVFFY